ncbi:MAG: 50S ribosomal protein L10 [Sphaerochaetaceae bacterium]|jgi:large subunit ribosomal protein L10|nr:50S ribosomal protein L10 [Sphaerochaetaceae bacterium]
MDYQTRINDAKTASVDALREQFKSYDGYVFADYRGITVAQISDLRRQLREKGAICKIVKNRYAKIAMEELNHSGFEQYLAGPTAVIMSNSEEQGATSKIVLEFAKAAGKFAVKGGILDGKVFDAAQVEAFAKLPTRLELIASLMGTMKAPVQKLAATLLAYQAKLEEQNK